MLKLQFLLFLATIVPLGLQGTEEQEVQNVAAIPEDICSSSEFLIRGIVLLPNEDSLLQSNDLSLIAGFDSSRIHLPGMPSKLQKQLEIYYANGKWSKEILQKIKQSIYLYYQKEGRPFVIVSLPPQDEQSQVVQVVVEESKLESIEIIGNKWTSDKRYLSYFKTKPGDLLSEKKINKDINFINRNPFRRAEPLFSPGVEANTTSLILQVSDHKPYQFYAGFDNTGVPTTGRQRVYAGFSWDQLFDLDHTIFYQYTTNYNANRFHANTFQYTAFLPIEMILNIYGGFAHVSAALPSPDMRNKGTNIQASLRWIAPFTPRGTFNHEIIGGFDYKNTNNTVEFVDTTPVFGHTVNLTQFMIGYRYEWDKRLTRMEGGAEIYFSPFEWLPLQSDANFSSLRPNAKNRWVYGYAFFNIQQTINRQISYSLYLKGQLSQQTLLPSEQLGLGGYNTVRGYDERQYNADSGLYGNFELRSKTIQLFRKGAHGDSLHFLAFIDGGFGFDKTSVPMVKQQNFLIGAGPGLRYKFPPYFSARFDLGAKLHHQEDFTSGPIMIHFNTTGSY